METKYMRALLTIRIWRSEAARALPGAAICRRDYSFRLLPVVDTFGKVKDHLNDPGLDLAYKELVSVLVEQGVERIEVLGRQFDPTHMDCIEVVEGKENQVMEEVAPGYRFRGKVLRVARVKVGGMAPKSN